MDQIGRFDEKGRESVSDAMLPRRDHGLRSHCHTFACQYNSASGLLSATGYPLLAPVWVFNFAFVALKTRSHSRCTSRGPGAALYN